MAGSDGRSGLTVVPCQPEDVRGLALMLPETVEGAHQGHPDFRVGGRIYATLWTEEERVVVRLTPETQAEMVDAEPDVFELVPGAWGSRGWTSLALYAADEDLLRKALLDAWMMRAPPGSLPDTTLLLDP